MECVFFRGDVMENLIFFDIDGTLVEDGGYLPTSTIQALHAAQDKGTHIFINTGRTRVTVDDFLRDVGFDGYVYGCGTMIEYHGEILSHTRQTPARSQEMLSLVRETNAAVLYERSDAIFIDSQTRFLSGLEDLLSIYRRKHMDYFPVPDDADWYTDKFVIWYDEKTDLAAFKAGIAGKFEYIDRGNCFAEMIPCGCSKAAGMQTLAARFAPSPTRTFAVGDSLNDRSMIESADVGIAMGDDPVLYPYADYVTTNLREDGIARAMAHFNLI